VAGLSVEEFEEQVLAVCAASFRIKSIAEMNTGLTWLQLRAYLFDESFIDVFYNQQSGKITFAQIRENRRIFGADNKKGWHWHPLEDPGKHLFVETEISFAEFLRQVEDHLNQP
jgi:hypothetical protein